MRSYTHWFKISGTLPAKEEVKHYCEIQGYLDRYPESAATVYLYNSTLCDRVIQLKCSQDWKNLDLYVTFGLTRLSRKPKSICNPQSFMIPSRLREFIAAGFTGKN